MEPSIFFRGCNNSIRKQTAVRYRENCSTRLIPYSDKGINTKSPGCLEVHILKGSNNYCTGILSTLQNQIKVQYTEAEAWFHCQTKLPKSLELYIYLKLNKSNEAIAGMESQRWLPLEANPDVMNQFLKQLGLLPTWQFGDVYGLDPDLLSMVPRPVCSVLLLFPVTEKYESYRLEEEAKIKSQSQEVSSEVYFMKQTISNACGTIGLIHAVANNQDRLEFGPGSALKKFLSESSSLSPEEKAKFLEEDESIRVTHESSAQEGQTEAPSIDEKVDLHFIAFVNVGGKLYELDGRKPFPIAHGTTTEDTFLENAAEVCKEFMARDPDELRFTVVALSKV